MYSRIWASVCVVDPGTNSDPSMTPVAFAISLARLKPCTASSLSVLVSNQFGFTRGLSEVSVVLIVTFPREVVVSTAIEIDA